MLLIAAEAPHIHALLFHFTLPNHEDHRHFRKRMLAHLVVYLFVPVIDLHAQPRAP